MYIYIYMIVLQECNIYFIYFLRVGLPNAKQPPDIQLSGTHIKEEHCMFENIDGKSLKCVFLILSVIMFASQNINKQALVICLILICD